MITPGAAPLDDHVFEARLTKLYAEAPSLGDSRLFLGRVETRLGRSWALRRALIATGGVIGGIIVVGQAVGSGLWARISVATRLVDTARQGLAHVRMPSQLALLAERPFGAEGLWLAVGLVVLAVALIAGPSLDDL